MSERSTISADFDRRRDAWMFVRAALILLLHGRVSCTFSGNVETRDE